MRANPAWGAHIADGVVNEAIRLFHEAQPDREQTCASPSTLTECPRVVWLRKKGVEPTNTIGWGKKQRFMLGRITEDLIAEQLRESGNLLWAWPDNYIGQSKKFEHGVGVTRITGTPDLLIRVGNKVAISDAKTSRSDSFKYVPLDPAEIWTDYLWFKYKMQLTAYFLLCHWNEGWFTQRHLPLPNYCHLFSYALDDGIVRREVLWRPTQKDAQTVLKYVRRWNKAYISEQMPECVCKQEGQVKFCKYGIKTEDEKICTDCCKGELYEIRQISADNSNGNLDAEVPRQHGFTSRPEGEKRPNTPPKDNIHQNQIPYLQGGLVYKQEKGHDF